MSRRRCFSHRSPPNSPVWRTYERRDAAAGTNHVNTSGVIRMAHLEFFVLEEATEKRLYLWRSIQVQIDLPIIRRNFLSYT